MVGWFRVKRLKNHPTQTFARLKGCKNKIMNYIWSFDLSLSNTGVSIFEENGNPCYTFSVSTNPKDSHGKRLKTIADKILKVAEYMKPSLIVVESCFTRFNKSTHALYEIRGVLLYLFSDCELVEIVPTSVKKLITNDGRAEKQKVQEVILSKYKDVCFGDYDQSDAFALGIAYFIKSGVIKF